MSDPSQRPAPFEMPSWGDIGWDENLPPLNNFIAEYEPVDPRDSILWREALSAALSEQIALAVASRDAEIEQLKINLALAQKGAQCLPGATAALQQSTARIHELMSEINRLIVQHANALGLIVQFAKDGIMSEGQCCATLGIDRIEWRKICDDWPGTRMPRE